MPPSDAPVVQSAATSFAVLEAIRELGSAGPSELARHLDMSKSGVFKHVRTLADRDYLVEVDGEYRLGMGIWTLGAGARDVYPVAASRTVVDSLAASVGHAAHLVIYEAGVAASVYRDLPTANATVVGSLGDPLPLTATAAGKAIIAYLPTEHRQAVLDDAPFDEYTDETTTETAALAQELDRVREQRTAIELGEYRPDVNAIASPILDDTGTPLGALYVTAAANALTETHLEEKIPGLVVSAARSVENAVSVDLAESVSE